MSTRLSSARRNWPLLPVLAAPPGVVLRFSGAPLLLAAVVLVIRRRAMWATLRDGLSGRALRQDST